MPDEAEAPTGEVGTEELRVEEADNMFGENVTNVAPVPPPGGLEGAAVGTGLRVEVVDLVVVVVERNEVEAETCIGLGGWPLTSPTIKFPLDWDFPAAQIAGFAFVLEGGGVGLAIDGGFAKSSFAAMDWR